MIKLIKPVIYTVKENGVYVDKTEKDGPFRAVSEEAEEELVNKGFAVYVDDLPAVSANGVERKTSRKKK